MSETASPIVKKMKLLTLCTAISLFIVTSGVVYSAFEIFKDYKLPIPFPVNTALYSLFVLALLYAVFKMIMIYRNIPDNIESTLKHSLKQLNITYIIINALSIYAVITIGLTLFLSILEFLWEINGTYYGLEALAVFLARILETIIFIILLIPLIYPLVLSLINLVVNIIVAVKFDSYYKTTQHPKIKDWFTFVSGSRLFLGILMIFSVPYTKISLKDIPLIICLVGFTLYSIFILLLIRYYGKLIDIQTNPVIAVSNDIADTEVIGYENVEQYSNNDYNNSI